MTRDAKSPEVKWGTKSGQYTHTTKVYYIHVLYYCTTCNHLLTKGALIVTGPHVIEILTSFDPVIS